MKFLKNLPKVVYHTKKISYAGGKSSLPVIDVTLSIFKSETGFGFYQASAGPGLGPGPDFVHFESGPDPDFIKHVQLRVRVRVQILPISYSN